MCIVGIVSCVTAWYKLEVRRSTNGATSGGRIFKDASDAGQPESKTLGISTEKIVRTETAFNQSPDFNPSGALRYPDAEILESGRTRSVQ